MAKTSPRLLKPLRVVHGHRKLFASLAAGFALYIILPEAWRIPTRVLICWDSGAGLYLAIVLAAVGSFDLKRVRARAAEQDEGAVFVLIMTVVAAIASLVAVVFLLGAEKNSNGSAPTIGFALAVVTILVSWGFIHLIFALHYAHEFYGEGADERCGGLQFPDDNRPDYWDFIYFSFVIGMTFQVSDVQVTSKRIRHVVVAHGIVSFLFSVAILALAVNIGSNLI